MTPAEADAYLHDAIALYAEANDFNSEGFLLNQWAIVAHWQRVEDNDTSTYTVHTSGSTIIPHVAIGLFSVGLEHCYGDDD